MNPFERRIIHMALQDDPHVETKSEGEGNLKKVKVFLKKRKNG
jgi:spoIIIJ-associated protein